VFQIKLHRKIKILNDNQLKFRVDIQLPDG